MKNQKGFGAIYIVIIILIIGLIVGIYIVQKPTHPKPFAKERANYSGAINSDSDLMRASSQLDYTNVDSIDSQLKQNDVDSANF